MFYYKIKFWISDEKKRRNCNLLDWLSLFETERDNYNEVSRTARNPKQIKEFKVESDCLYIVLESKDPLATPTLALRSFSMGVAKTEFGKGNITDNSLFRGTWEKLEMENESVVNHYDLAIIWLEMLSKNQDKDQRLISEISEKLIAWKKKGEDSDEV